MRKVNEKTKYLNFFDDYEHNIPVIYSSLEGQYPGELYLDENVEFAILFTPFAFHFVGGNPHAKDIVNKIDQLVFHEYIQKTNQKEAIFFCPNSSWYPVLDEVYKRHNGVKDIRKIYQLNLNKFQSLPEDHSKTKKELTYVKELGSTIPYPICKIFNDNDEEVSFCTAFMLGKGHGEIDVGTNEEYRNKGYAKLASHTLIKELLKQNITPDWCTWPYRVESQRLAEALGFELKEEVIAYIWTENDCGKIK